MPHQQQDTFRIIRIYADASVDCIRQADAVFDMLFAARLAKVVKQDGQYQNVRVADAFQYLD
ncbi:MAG: hypothetical protein BWX80_04105 [Candidatus Hydrogenedentes bacterium ADurb.Bin101]|nr:MAG: hypothetical protein BWX80_04105 [Candidatus Hydrogenedentes bacterium ADurb.Bin101]